MPENDNFDRPATRQQSVVTTAHSLFFYKLSFLQPSKKTLVAWVILLMLVFLIWFAGHNASKTALNLSAHPQSATTNSSQGAPVGPVPQQAASQLDSAPADSNSGTTEGGSASNSNHTDVTVNGQSVNVDTNDNNPDASVNKTINTSSGSAHVSIQSNVSSGTNGHSSSFQNTDVNSSGSGDSNTDINVNQRSSGGSM